MLRTQKYTIQTRKLTAPVTIAHLSDLHGFSQSPTAGAILRAIRSENPDIVAMTGDMVDSRTADTEPFLSLCRELARGYLSYYIPGNHEQALGKVRFPRLLRDIDSTGVSVLDNRRQYLSVRGQNMAIYGLTTPLSSYKSILTEQLLGEPVILLQQHGFTVQAARSEKPCRVRLDVQYFKRVLDNLFDNVCKYADPAFPVTVKVAEEAGWLRIRIGNVCKKELGAVESNHIGLKTCERIMSQMGGSFCKYEQDPEFSVELTLPLLPEAEK